MCTSGHCYWTRELTQLELKLLGPRSCDHCHATPPSHVLTLDTGVAFYICGPCHTHTQATQCTT